VFEGKINETEYQRVFEGFEQDRPDALIVSESSVHFTNRATIVELAGKHRFPTLYTWRDFVEIGGLIAYSFDLAEMGRSIGSQIGQILSGTNPGDIPFNRATRYELAINLKAAKSLGLESPTTLLGSADFVVERGVSSEIGTKQKWCDVRSESVVEGKAGLTIAIADFRV